MPNTTREDLLADAGLAILAESGLRGVTHRAVDRAAGLAEGSCSNCFRTRDELILALGKRIYVRLTPDDDYLEARSADSPTRAQWVRLMVELLERVRAEPELHLALLELRLEATRRPELVGPLSAIVAESLDADMRFHTSSGLPGGRHEIVLMHLAIGGLVTEMLTLPTALGITDTTAIIEALVERLIYHQHR